LESLQYGLLPYQLWLRLTFIILCGLLPKFAILFKKSSPIFGGFSLHNTQFALQVTSPDIFKQIQENPVFDSFKQFPPQQFFPVSNIPAIFTPGSVLP
jgi:hypothetical protein